MIQVQNSRFREQVLVNGIIISMCLNRADNEVKTSALRVVYLGNRPKPQSRLAKPVYKGALEMQARNATLPVKACICGNKTKASLA